MAILDQKHTTMHVEYSVSRYDGGRERKVTLNSITKDITYSCNLFEQEGILCSHALKVYNMVGIKFIFDQYVTKRWTKKARSGGNVDCKDREISSDLSLSIFHRYRLLTFEMVRLATRVAMSEAATKLVSSVMSELSKRVKILFCGEINEITQNSASMDLCKKIQVQNAAGHFVTPTGLKKQSGRKTKKVLRSWVNRFHWQKKSSKLSKANTPEMVSTESLIWIYIIISFQLTLLS
ncbi:protein FAR1-RELATED SEQUENCE 4-like [Coffea arabica]|uniref:Protein FAR1-RELATED SEQUENCE n=1 Tax=Coffea arabica TaxID=13443 RepID=A0A6P6U0H0_COFAR